jgi:hypothetical protein
MAPDKTVQHDVLAEFESSASAARIGFGRRSTTGISARLPIGLLDRSPVSTQSKTNSF